MRTAMKKLLVVAPFVVLVAVLVSLSWPVSESTPQALLTYSPVYETASSGQVQAVTGIDWYFPTAPEPGEMDPHAIVTILLKADKDIPPGKIDDKQIDAMLPEDPRATGWAREQQMTELRGKMDDAKDKGFKKGDVIRTAKRRPGGEVYSPISDEQRMKQRVHVEGTGITEKEVRATVVELQGQIPAYRKLGEADSPDEFHDPRAVAFDKSRNFTIADYGYTLEYEGGMTYTDPLGKPYYIVQVTYPDGDTNRYWVRDDPAIIRDPTDEHRNILVHFDPDARTASMAVAKSDPPGTVGILEAIARFLSDLLGGLI